MVTVLKVAKKSLTSGTPLAIPQKTLGVLKTRLHDHTDTGQPWCTSTILSTNKDCDDFNADIHPDA